MNQHPELLLHLARQRQDDLRRSAWTTRLRRDDRQRRRHLRPPT